MALTSCLLTAGYGLECRNSIGGIQNIYIGTYNGSSMTYTLGTVSTNGHTITAFGGSTVSFYTFNQPLETGEFTQAGAFSTENGTSMYSQTVNLTLVKLNDTTAKAINTLGQGIWRIIILDQNGLYWYIGAQNGARVTAATPQAGKALGDLNGAIVTLEAKEPLTAYVVTTAAALSLITA